MPRPLPLRPNLEQLKHQAKDLLKSHHAGDAAACGLLRRLPRLAAATDAELLAAVVTLNDAQFALALEYGFESWQALKQHVDSIVGARGVRKENARTWIEGVPELRWGQSGECTLAGALSAALSVTPSPSGYADLMGWSGLAFRFRWYRRFDEPGWCPSSPVGEFSEEITAAAKASAWEIEQETRMGQDHPDMSPCAPAIRQSIEAGYPVVGYPDSDLNVAVAYGFEEAEGQMTFLWNAYGRSGLRVPASKVGPWLMFLRAQGKPMSARAAMVQALSTPNWRRKRLPHWGKNAGEAAYLYGADALRTWREDIGQAETFPVGSRKSLFFVSWWCFDCFLDAREAAATFLRKHADDLEDETRPTLLRAAELYSQEVKFLQEVVAMKNAFLGPWTAKKFEDWSDPVRRRECEVIQQIEEREAKAVNALDEALAPINRSEAE
jgi:hypothetical protein